MIVRIFRTISQAKPSTCSPSYLKRLLEFGNFTQKGGLSQERRESGVPITYSRNRLSGAFKVSCVFRNSVNYLFSMLSGNCVPHSPPENQLLAPIIQDSGS